jgi:hypothetical protein
LGVRVPHGAPIKKDVYGHPFLLVRISMEGLEPENILFEPERA